MASSLPNKDPCTVSELLQNDPTKLSYDERLRLKERGRNTPSIKFEGKRQCRLSEHYERWKWLCGSEELKSLFCFPCLMLHQVSLNLSLSIEVDNHGTRFFKNQ